MANSIFLWPGTISAGGNLIVGGQILASDGSVSAPGVAFTNAPNSGFSLRSGSTDIVTSANGTAVSLIDSARVRLNGAVALEWSSGAPNVLAGDTILVRDAANTLALRNGTNAQTARVYGYISGSRFTYEAIQAVTTAVTLSGATSGTGNVIPAGATVVDIATSTTTTITGASGYQVGDGSDADRYGDITGTAVGTNSDSADYTADPRWWATSARAVTLTAKTSNFTGGVVQVTVFYMAATAA